MACTFCLVHHTEDKCRFVDLDTQCEPCIKRKKGRCSFVSLPEDRAVMRNLFFRLGGVSLASKLIYFIYFICKFLFF